MTLTSAWPEVKRTRVARVLQRGTPASTLGWSHGWRQAIATIKEVASHARVSVGTVSNVLAGEQSVGAELRERVEASIRALDYHPNHIARSLKSRQTKTLGIVISDITNPFFPLVV